MMNNREAEADQMMRWPSEDNSNANDEKEVEIQIERSDSPSSSSFARSDDNNISRNPPISTGGVAIGKKLVGELRTIACPSCAHHIPINHQGGILHDLPGMPAGVKFDPTDVEILEHLEAKVHSDSRKLHPLIDEFIQTLEGENGICYTHPEKLPGVSKDGMIRHYFHRPSKAYTTGTRKRRKVSSDEDDGSGETRWHKTGKTRAVVVNGSVKGFKKILVLYTNYGRQRKPEKTKWVMHQYHIGHTEDEKDGEIVLSKVFYQTQPRNTVLHPQPQVAFKQPQIQYAQQQQQQQHQQQQLVMLQQVGSSNLAYYHQQEQPRFISFGDHHDQFVVGGSENKVPHQLVTNLGVVQGDVSLEGRNKQKEQLFEEDM